MPAVMARDSVPGLAKKLRAAREAAGLSQQELADAAGVHVMMISSYELDRRTPSVSTLIKLADALGVEVAELLPKKK